MMTTAPSIVDLTASSPIAASPPMRIPAGLLCTTLSVPPVKAFVQPPDKPGPTLLAQKNALLNSAIDSLNDEKFKAIAKRLCVGDAAIEAAFGQELLVDQKTVPVAEESEGDSDEEEEREEDDGADEDEEAEKDAEDGNESEQSNVEDVEAALQSVKRGIMDDYAQTAPVKKRRTERSGGEGIGRGLVFPSLDTGKKPTLREAVANVFSTLPEAKIMTARFRRCTQCAKDFDVTCNSKRGCRWHPGEVEPDLDDFFADHDENCHGPIDGTEDEYPEGWFWDCCNQDYINEGCEMGWHRTEV